MQEIRLNSQIPVFNCSPTSAEVTHGSQLQRKAQAIVVAATAHYLRAVVVAEMKTTGQVVRRHHVGITAITITLGCGEKTDGHRCTSSISGTVSQIGLNLAKVEISAK